MNPAQLLAHFDRVSEAPDAIPRLRRFVLDLAVRGKLVEQDPDDEPASDLVKRIQTEKARLVKAGEIRKERPLPLVEEDEAPYSSPTRWEWVRIRQVTSDRGQMTPDKDFTYIDVTAINKEVGCVAYAKVLSPLDAPSRARKMVRTGDVLYSCVRPYLLNIAVIERDIVPSPIASTAFAVLNGFGLVLSKYLWIALRSPFMVECVEAKMRGQAYPAINDSDFAILPLPLPPLAEQHRIAAKVDELMALCDRLAAAQAERESRRDRLVAATCARLSDLATRNSYHSTFFINHLPHLTTRTEHIQQLRQTILNLAVRGQLVPQDPNDEPAPEFGIGLEPDQEDRLSLRLPTGWSWARVGDVADARLGKMLDKAKNAGRPYRYLRNTNVHWFNVRMDELKYLRIEEAEIEKYLLRDGDVLICEGGHGIGRTAVWRDKEFDIAFQKALHRVRPRLALSSDFFAYCMFVYFHARVLQTYFTGVGIPHFTGNALSTLVFPLPPLAEQHRIVAKVDEFMPLCDRLEESLAAAQTDSRRLLEAILDDALSTHGEILQEVLQT